MNAAALLRLLQFASPALPIGGYSYSQGLETAIDRGVITDAASSRDWIAEYLDVLSLWEAPIVWRMMQAPDGWNERFIASRDTAEFRAETIQMGYSLARLLDELGVPQPGGEVALPTAFACAVNAFGIPHEEALLAMLFAWCENQVQVCVKSVPLGQVAGQRLLLSLAPDIERAAARARQLTDDELSNWAPGLSMLSMRHEVQHGRLYRS